MIASGGVVLDAGAFIALERRSPTMVRLAQLFAREKTSLVTSAGVVAQVWRGGAAQQVPLVYLLRRTAVIDISFGVARVLGQMLGATHTTDPVDAHVVFLARERGWAILTSDPSDLRALDPNVRVERI